MVTQVAAVTEVKPGQKGHVSDDEPQGDVADVQPGQAEVCHVAEFAAIVQLSLLVGGTEEFPHLCVPQALGPSQVQGAE